MPNKYWRSPETIENLSRLERPGFAVELLRRNAAYRRDYARMLRQVARKKLTLDAALSNLGHRWGLRFRP